MSAFMAAAACLAVLSSCSASANSSRCTARMVNEQKRINSRERPSVKSRVALRSVNVARIFSMMVSRLSMMLCLLLVTSFAVRLAMRNE